MLGDFLKETLLSLTFFGSAGIVITSGYKLFKNRKVSFLDNLHQTIEDRSCSTQIIGVQGSGKTYLAMKLFIDDINSGYGALWMSTQGINNSNLLNYIPSDRVNETILLRPYGDNIRGINLLKRYTKTKLERMLIADSVVTLFKRLFDDFKVNMESILTASVLALLEYSDNTNRTVCLWDLYVFLTNKDFRSIVVKSIKNIAVQDMLNELNSGQQANNSLDAILRRFRKILYNENLIAFLCMKENDVDLLKAMKTKKIIICDFLSGGVGGEGIGKEASRFLAELVVTKLQLVAETRNVHSTLFPMYLDEFATYTTISDNVKDFIDLNRQRRTPVTLLHQRRDQLSQKLQNAADACGTKYVLKLNKNDWKHYQQTYEQYKNKIPKMKNRECITDILSSGKNHDNWIKKTEDVPKKSDLGHMIEENNLSQKTVDEIVKDIIGNPISKDKISKNEFQ